jgi:molecular chaperone HtpG
MAKGSIGVTTNNIFPVIKKFLYSDHEIFLRELISNAVDATQKLKTLAAAGDFKGETEDLKVSVTIDKDAGTLTVSDHGIGMTEQDVDKYINQIAFSGADEFLKKFEGKAEAIIGHFGLGFYSAFMVASSVEILTKSYQEGAKAVKWTCDGSPNFTIDEIEKENVGTDIVLHIDADAEEYLKKERIEELLEEISKKMDSVNGNTTVISTPQQTPTESPIPDQVAMLARG